MKRLISRYDEEYYTCMLKVLNSLGGRKLKYKWLITDIDAYPENSKLKKLVDLHEYFILTTDELIDCLEEDDCQWIWGVFSAIPLEFTEEEIMQYRMPDVSITERAFQDECEIQHQLAEIEIDCIDSAYFQVIVKNEELLRGLKESYKYITEDLIDPIELFVTNDKRNSSEYYEFQYCKNKDVNKKSLPSKLFGWLSVDDVDFWKSDSLFLYMEVFEKFYRKYPYFKETYNGDFCYWTSNYYTKEMTIEIIKKLKEECYDKNNQLIRWLEKAVNEYNGFYILGI